MEEIDRALSEINLEKVDLSFDIHHVIDGIDELLFRQKFHDEALEPRHLEVIRDDLRRLIRRLQ